MSQSTTNLRSEMYQAVRDGKAQVLTLEKAKSLVGKKIATIYYGYAGQDGTDEFTVGSIQSEWDFEGSQKIGDTEQTFQDRWTQLDAENPGWGKVKESKSRLMLITSDLRNTYISCNEDWPAYFPEATFTCSDADREVYFIER